MAATIPEYTNDNFQHTSSFCDLVMKGGITSGVVYPPAILKLATYYKFRAIGGTSAGAIAAAGAAAAEYNREHDGFVRLYQLQQTLNQKNFVLNLFQPMPRCRVALNTLLAVASEKRTQPDIAVKGMQKWKNALWFRIPLRIRQLLQMLKSLLIYSPLACLIGAILCASLSLGLIRLFGGSLNWEAALILFCSAVLGAIVVGIGHLCWILFYKVPVEESFFGMCIGHKNSQEGPKILTDWLSEQYDYIAGKPHGQPLTFGDLHDAHISLKFVTTSLSHNQPYLFPRPQMNFIFKESEMRQFFPGYVVDYMVKVASNPEQQKKNIATSMEAPRTVNSLRTKQCHMQAEQELNQSQQFQLPTGYYFLPSWHDLPVIIATRMSLSFPILLCAVPLYTIDSSAFSRLSNSIQLTEDNLQKNWFSDGGICSNFPIHFFDTWLPQYPTFGINLMSLPKKSDKPASSKQVEPLIPRSVSTLRSDIPVVSDSDQRVFLPRASALLDPEYNTISGFFGFLQAIMGTMQNYHDNTQSRLPGYRERIVQVRFDNEREGGLNLAMAPETIQNIINMGEEAAEKLLPTGQFNLEEHKWVRLRILMAQLEEQLERLGANYPSLCAYQQILNAQIKGDGNVNTQFYCHEDQEWCDATQKRLQALLTFIDEWKKADESWQQTHPDWPADEHFFAYNAPMPMPVLRISPDL